MLTLFYSRMRSIDLAIDADCFVTSDTVEFNRSFGMVRTSSKVQRFVSQLHSYMLRHYGMKLLIRIKLMKFIIALAA